MKTLGIVWVLLGAGFFVPSIGWAEVGGAKTIFASGEGPTVMAATPDSVAPLRSVRQPTPAQANIAKKAELHRERYVGLSYWVELVGSDGEHTRVPTDRVFRNGERIRFNLMSNWDGYLYLITLGATGRAQVLFPHPTVAGGNGAIKGNTAYEVPHDTYLRFGDHPGEDIIFVMLSPEPLPGFARSPSPQMQALSREDTERLAIISYLKGAKDLLLEIDTFSPQPASYVVAPLSMLQGEGQMIALQVKLKHH
jgi:hypothetical protein